METLVLSDRTVVPDDDLVFSIIGQNRIHWKNLLDTIRKKFPDVQEVWHYYNDGKSWLFRTILKKKTLFWIGVLKDTFRITFYLGDKTEPLIDSSDLPEKMKIDFKNGRRFGKLRAISIRVGNAEDIQNAVILTDIRAR